VRRGKVIASNEQAHSPPFSSGKRELSSLPNTVHFATAALAPPLPLLFMSILIPDPAQVIARTRAFRQRAPCKELRIYSDAYKAAMIQMTSS